ncbi:MAG: DMT family transporter [Bacillota bacterium]
MTPSSAPSAPPEATAVRPAPTSAPIPFGPLDALLVLVTIVWGLNSVAIKYAVGRFLPMVFNSLRFTYATALIFLVMWLTEGRRGGRQAMALPRKDLLVVAGIGLAGHFFYQWLYINGISLSTAGNTAFIMATAPVSIALLSTLTNHDRLSRAAWAGIALSLAGVVTVAVGAEKSFSFGAASVRGDLLTLIAVSCWAVYTIASKPLLGNGDGTGGRYSPTKLTAWTMLFGTIGLVLISLPQFPKQDWSAVGPLAWAALLLSGALGLVGPYIIWNYGVERLGPARTGAYHNLTPITTSVFAYWLLAEKWTTLRFVGVLVILIGVTVVRRAKGRPVPSRSA